MTAALLVLSPSIPAARQASVGAPLLIESLHNDVSPPLRELADVRPAVAVPARPTGGGRLLGPIESFEGIANVENELVGATTSPVSDAVGDVGPRHYVQWVNTSLAVYDKHGARLVGPLPGNRLWRRFGSPCEASNRGDPIVLYDELADRWVLTQFAAATSPRGPVAPFVQCIAVSTSPDPTATYYRYAFPTPHGFDNDYAKLGVWPDAYYMSDAELDGREQKATGAFAFDRLGMLRGRPGRAVYMQLQQKRFGVLPADLDGARAPPAGAPGLFVTLRDDDFGADADAVELWRFHADYDRPSASRLEGPDLLPTRPFDGRLCETRTYCVAQPETESGLDALASKLMFRAAYRNLGDFDTLVVNHTVDVDGTERAGIRWYEIRDPTGRPRLHQQGDHAVAGQHRWLGSIAVDRRGNIALGFSASGRDLFPSIAYTGRLVTDRPATLPRGEGLLAVGARSQSASQRWGDYSALSVDPVDDCTFWYTNQYYGTAPGGSWHTRIASFVFPGCGEPLAVTGTPRIGETIAAETASTPTALQWRRCGGTGANCADIAGATGAAYTVGAADAGATFRVLARFDDAEGARSSLSAATATVAHEPPQLVLALTASRARARVGRRFSITSSVANVGAGRATGVTLVLRVPGGHALEPTGFAGRCARRPAPTCDVGALDPGGRATLGFTVRPRVRGPLGVSANVRAAEAETDTSDNSARATVVVHGPPRIGRLGGGQVRAVHRGSQTVVGTTVEVDEAALVSIEVRARGRLLTLLRGSRVGGRVLTRASTRMRVRIPGRRLLALLIVLPPSAAGGGLLSVGAVDSDGMRSRLRIPFARARRPR